MNLLSLHSLAALWVESCWFVAFIVCYGVKPWRFGLWSLVIIRSVVRKMDKKKTIINRKRWIYKGQQEEASIAAPGLV